MQTAPPRPDPGGRPGVPDTRRRTGVAGEARRPPAGLIAAATLIATLFGCLLWLGILAAPFRLATGLLGAGDHLREGQKALSNTQLKAAHDEILAAVAATREAKTGLKGPQAAFDLLRLSPRVDAVWDDADHLITAAKQSGAAARGSLRIAEKALRGGDKIIKEDPEHEGDSYVDLERVDQIAGAISKVREHLQRVVAELSEVDVADLPRRARPRVTDGLEEAREADTILADAEAGFAVMPEFLGANGPRTYLIGMQNSAEERGTGGAILRFTYLKMDNGRSNIAEDKSVYDVDTENRKQLDIDIPPDDWYVAGIEDAQRFGNANWSPDWPTSAKLMLEYAYTAEAEIKSVPDIPDFDGVITLDPKVMELLIPGTGPFRVGGQFSNRITANNAVNFLLYKAYASYPRTKVRRGVLKRTVRTFNEAMLDPKHPTELVTGLGTALDTKHMFMWMKNPDLQAFVERMNWDASIDPAKNKDYVYVVEQNVGGNKFDYHADNTTTMDISLTDTDATTTTEMRIDNDTFFPQPSWAVGDSGKRDPAGNRRVPTHEPMMNLYVPGNAELIGWEVEGSRIDAPPPAIWSGGRPPEHTESGKKVWSATLEVPPEEQGAVGFEYRSPGVVRTENDRHVYTLVVQHQPRVRPEMLDITLSLPEGAENVVAPGWERKGDDLVWSRPLVKDMELEVSWR